jgi:lysozyme
MGMKPRHQVSKAAVGLIKTFEGYRGKAAQLPDGRWTIGFGHTLTAREGAQVSEQDAEALLLYDLIGIAHAVNEQTFTPLTQNQFDALCCFAFNVGLDNFKRSSVLRRVNEGSLLQAACAMEMWRKADFEGERIVVDALVRRRSAEKTLFLTPAGGWVPAPSPIVRPKVDYDAVNFVPRQTPTALNAPMTGDKAVVERETPVETSAPQAVADEAAAPAAPKADAPASWGVPPEPVVVTAAMTAAAAVASRLAEIVPDTAPQPAPEAALEPAMPAPQAAIEATQAADESMAWSPGLEAESADIVTAEDDDEADAYASPEDPVLEITRTPAEPTLDPAPDALAVPPPPVAPEALPTQPESYTPYPATPTLAVSNGDRAFILTPAPEPEFAPAAVENPLAFQLPVAANESEPGLFDVSSQPFDPFTPVRTRSLVSEDHVRRLVAEDERQLAASFDPGIDGANLEQARIVGLPWLGAALAGCALFAGGVVWGFNDHTGNGVSIAIGWGLGIAGAGLFVFSAWRWLDGLGMPRLGDDDEDQPAE